MTRRISGGISDELRSRLIFALDVDSLAEAKQLVRLLAPEIGTFKIGKQLFLHAGPPVVDLVHRHGRDVFLDLKFHDIPTTVAKAGVEAARRGVRFFDLHASGGLAMMAETCTEVARACRRERLRRPRILAVTVLTSLAERDLRLVGVDDAVEDQAARLARLARRAGMDGVVASPLEIARIRRLAGPDLLIVTPGIRPASASRDDQKRVLSPEEAMRAGADYLVVGRPVRDAPDPLAVARELLADMARGLLAARPPGICLSAECDIVSLGSLCYPGLMPRLVKRYSNRKLYDTTESRYVTLDEIARWVKGGEEVKILENESGEDLTAITFAQIILEEERKKSGLLSLRVLRGLIQHGEAALHTLTASVESRIEAIRPAAEAARSRMQERVNGITSIAERLSEIQWNLDEVVRRQVERVTAAPMLQRELTRIERTLRMLEARIARLRATGEQEAEQEHKSDADRTGNGAAAR